MTSRPSGGAASSAVPSKLPQAAARKETGAAGGSSAAAAPATRSIGAKEQGGVRITREEVEEAFQFFDVSGSGVLKPRDLKARLSAFYPHMTNKEYRFLISEPNFTVDALWALLENNTISNFDPVKEAFKVYDPNGSGYVDTEVLRQIMGRMGYGDMSREDMEVLVKTADVDGDGRISLEDFRSMLALQKHGKE